MGGDKQNSLKVFSVSKARHAFPTGPTLKLHGCDREGGSESNRPRLPASCGFSTGIGYIVFNDDVY